jgi:hypothetical protein
LAEEGALLVQGEASKKTRKRRRGPYRKAWASARKAA